MGLFEKKKSNKIKYVFAEERNSFPVVEFISSPDESLNIPSFILEIAWPRVVYIYFPNRDDYQYFHNDYVQIARRIRSESDILVLFYAISCAAHNSMCANTDLVKTPNRPLLIAYESESTEGKEILIESPVSTIENANKILHQLCHSLYIGDSIGKFHNVDSQHKYLQGSDSKARLDEPMQQTMVRGIEKKSSDKILHDTFVDAQKAFILTLEFNVYDNLSDEHNDELNGSAVLTKHKADVLRDFLDLCYWTLPPDWKIQEIILALRTDFSSVTKDRNYLQSVLVGVQDLRIKKWSDTCTLPPDDNAIINGIDMASYSCGLWKLLHIIGFGATESYSHVMGDTARTKPTYVTWVIRDFIAEFMPDEQHRGSTWSGLVWCKGCRESVVNSYDSCEEKILCFHNDHISVDVITSESYVPVSKWLWNVQKRAGPETKIASNTNKFFVYNKVKKDYWPSNLKIVRVSVLKRFVRQELPELKSAAKSAQEQAAFYMDFTMIILLCLCVLLSRRVRGSYSMRRKEK